MLHFIHSNRMEMLADKAVEQIKVSRENSSNPLQTQTVLVQSPGMSQWLKLQIAERIGISANIEFPLPSSFIWRLYQQYFTDLPDRSDFNKDAMAWKLFDIFHSLPATNDFQPIADYLTTSSQKEQLKQVPEADAEYAPLKRFQLCQQLADLYDQYLMYRPDWIERWENGDVSQLTEADKWQGILWQQLVEHTDRLHQSPYHRANLHKQLLNNLENNSSSQKQDIFIFGISTMPTQQLEVLQALALSCEVFIFWLNPCQQYWGDVVNEKTIARIQLKYAEKSYLKHADDDYLISGNPLLSSWGQLGKEYLEWQLDQQSIQHDVFVENQPNSLLSQIQHDILQMQFRDSMESLDPMMLQTQQGKYELAAGDNSLQFHGCHSELREIEVLHDQLLLMLQNDTELEPKDIIVMMPDVGKYIPHINTVFANADKTHFIPFAISDQSLALESLTLNSFLNLLSLPDWRFKQSEIIDLLEVPEIHVKFDIASSDIKQIQYWLDEAAIRWGIDAKHKVALGLPDDQLNTWRHGLNRLLAGYALHGEALYQEYLPVEGITGSAAELLGNFCLFIERLIDFREALSGTHSLNEFSAILLTLVDSFYSDESKTQQDVITIREAIQTVADSQINCEQLIDIRIIREFLSEQLQQRGVSQSFLTGQLNFCSLMPMRSIPFKVICLVGMNEGEYPRLVTQPSYDLIAKDTRRQGDRSRQLDDRYLLLEALLSARDKLYISYQGRSSRDNSVRLPSLLISELMQYCDNSVTVSEAQHNKPDEKQGSRGAHLGEKEQSVLTHLVTEHPLQPFSDIYFSSNDRRVSCNRQWFSIANNIQNNRDYSPVNNSIDVESQIEQIDVDDWVRFFLNPCEYFAKNLGIRFPWLNAPQQDDEIFEFDNLSGFKIRNSLLIGETTELLAAKGMLPLHSFAELNLEKEQSKLTKLVSYIEKNFHNFEQKSKQAIELSINNCEISGWISLSGEQLIFARAAKFKVKYQLETWIKHLLLCASGYSAESLLLSIDEGVLLKNISQSQAIEELEQLQAIFQQGLQRPLCFFPQTSLAWASYEGDSKRQHEVTLAFDGGRSGLGDVFNSYISHFYPNSDSFDESFAPLAETIFKPMLEVSERITYG